LASQYLADKALTTTVIKFFNCPWGSTATQPVLEIVDSTGTRYQTCGYYGLLPGQANNLPCINHLPGNQYLSNDYYAFQVPGSGTSPVTFFIRVLDARGDARPDFIYTFTVYGVN